MPVQQEAARVSDLSKEREAWKKLMFDAQQNHLAKLFAQELKLTAEEYKKSLPDFEKFKVSWEKGEMSVIIEPRFNLGVVLERTSTIPNIDTTTTKDTVKTPKVPYVVQVVVWNMAATFEEAEAHLKRDRITGLTAREGAILRALYPAKSVARPEHLFGSRTDGIYVPHISKNPKGQNEMGIDAPIEKPGQIIRYTTVLARV